MGIEGALSIYTDGSSLQSPRVGGIGVRFVTIDESGYEVIQDASFRGYKNATNNQMELQACIMALKEGMRLHLTSGVSKVVIHSDSLYVVDNYQKAMFEWSKSKWLTKSGRPVLNADLWKELVKQIKKVRKKVEIRWIQGRSKSVHNKAVDRLARQSARLPTNKPISAVQVRRKLSDEAVDLGSFRMLGQRMNIRIITAEYLKVQRVHKYKYEVTAKANKFYGCVDIIFSEISLRASHTYHVTVNENPEIPASCNCIVRFWQNEGCANLAAATDHLTTRWNGPGSVAEPRVD